MLTLSHLRVKPVVGLVADDDGIHHAAGRLADFFGEFGNFFVAGNIFGIADAEILPRGDDFFVHINARDAQRPEEIALAAFVHADARQEQVGIQNGFVAELGLLENLRLQHELDKFRRALALHHQLAALVKHDVRLVRLEREPRIRHFARLPVARLQRGQQRRRLFVGQLASVDGERLHAEKINRKGTQRTQRILT